MNLKEHVAELIKNARKEKHLTLKELGGKIGITESAVAQYESGRRNLSLDTLMQITDALDMDVIIDLRSR